jgi:cytochrome c553
MDATVEASTGTAQMPPMGGPLVEAWLAGGAYKMWYAEPAIHASRSPSPHGFDRVYSNDLIYSNASGTGPWPAGAAAVKELYNSASDTTPVGYAVYLKTETDSAGGDNWYWYERVPLTSAAPHDENGVVADGLGSAATPDSGAAGPGLCVGCHSAAGSDAAHTPSLGGRDEVYTPVGYWELDASIDGPAGTTETPPMGAAAVETWLSGGAYKLWHSEPAVHASRSPSPHGFDRVYSNSIINANASATGPWPAGAAAVKELYNALTDTTPVGYAVYLKTQTDSANGTNWYWYERVPLTSAAPHDANGVVADGLGSSITPDSGAAGAILCVGCHSVAGSDTAHTPSVNGHDEVYTPVP